MPYDSLIFGLGRTGYSSATLGFDWRNDTGKVMLAKRRGGKVSGTQGWQLREALIFQLLKFNS